MTHTSWNQLGQLQLITGNKIGFLPTKAQIIEMIATLTAPDTKRALATLQHPLDQLIDIRRTPARHSVYLPTTVWNKYKQHALNIPIQLLIARCIALYLASQLTHSS